MIYDAFAHLPIYGLKDLGFVRRGEAGAFIAERNTAPGGKLPLNTNDGGLSLHAFRHVRHVRAAGHDSLLEGDGFELSVPGQVRRSR
jgi:hypothetical protein